MQLQPPDRVRLHTSRARALLSPFLCMIACGLTSCGSDEPGAGQEGPNLGVSPAQAQANAISDNGAVEEPTQWFLDTSEAWGIHFVHDAGISEERQLPETMGAGAAVFDVEGDGDLDLYFVQSGPLPTAANQKLQRPGNELWVQTGSGSFAPSANAAGDLEDAGYGQGVAVGDVDGDARPDLFLSNLGPDVLLMNQGQGRFRAGAREAGLRDERWSAGSVFFDADGDGDLDLYVAAYLDLDLEHPSICGRREAGYRSYCHPDHYAGLPDRFWRNSGDGKFQDATAQAGLADNSGKGLGVLAGDFDGDGDCDLYVANDSVENRFWVGNGNGGFDDGTLLSGTGVNGHGGTEAGMGLAAGDADGDLQTDLLVTNFDHESNTLYLGEGGGFYRDASAASGLEAASRMPVGFGVVMEDFNLDGLLDIAVANGHIIHNIPLYDEAQTHAQHAQLFMGGPKGTFRELLAQAGDLVRDPLVGRGLYAGDLDGDGDPDLVLTQNNGPARIFSNQTERRGIRLRGMPHAARVLLSFESGRRSLRHNWPATSYFGMGSDDIWIASPEGDALKQIEWSAPSRPETILDIPEPRTAGTLRYDAAAELPLVWAQD